MRLAEFDPMIGPTDFKSVLQVYQSGEWKAVCYPEVLENEEKHGVLGEVLCRSVGMKDFVTWNKAFHRPNMFLKNYTGPRTQMEVKLSQMTLSKCPF